MNARQTLWTGRYEKFRSGGDQEDFALHALARSKVEEGVFDRTALFADAYEEDLYFFAYVFVSFYGWAVAKGRVCPLCEKMQPFTRKGVEKCIMCMMQEHYRKEFEMVGLMAGEKRN